MKNMTKRLLCFAITLLMILPCFATVASAAAPVPDDIKGYVVEYDVKAPDTSIGVTQDTDDAVGHRFKVTADIAALGMQCATWDDGGVVASIHFAIYKWDTNYKKTVASEPLQTEFYENIKDNAFQWMKFDEPLPAGEYLLLAYEAKTTKVNWLEKQQVLWYGNPRTNKNAKGCVYVNGVELLGDMKTVFVFTEEVAEPFVQAEVSADYTAYDTSGNDVTGYQDWWRVGQANEIVGQRIKVTEKVLGYSIKTPTWGNTNVSVELVAYQWKDDYETTIAQGPFATARHDKVADGQDCWIVFDEAMPAGEYLFGIRNASEKGVVFAVYYYSENNKSLGYAYLDAAEHSCDLLMNVRLANATDTPFEKVTGYRDTTTGDVTVPEQWQIPEDSLINTHKVQPSTWVFTDGLGRESWEYGENGVGAVNDEKQLGVFYWSWKLNSSNIDRGATPVIQHVMDKYPEAKNDYNHPAWPSTGGYYWDVPLYGQYSGEDPWVLRRHAELLANAGVDFIFADNSNGITTWQDGYYDIYEEWTKAQNLGVNVPKVTFHLPMWTKAPNNGIDWWTTEQLESLYMDVYQQGQYQNLWYWWEGKPLLIAHSYVLDDSIPLEKEILNFFSFRAGVSSYKDNEDRNDGERIGSWGWSSRYPQATYHTSRVNIGKGIVEQMTVSVCSNFDYVRNATDAMNGANITGRSYTSTYKDRFIKEGYEASKWGYNMTEQFEYALTVDPQVIMFTGWNEFTVTRAQSWITTSNAFADQFDMEFSRDIEPTQGALKDYYYYLFVNYSRKFQGAEEMPVPSRKTTIDLSAGQDQWAAVEPYFGAYIGNTMDRDHQNRIPYSNPDFSGRNDIIGAQIARDDEFVYFNVECNEDITPYTDKLWMNLYIDTDQENKGWETFDFVVNKTAASEKTSVLEKFTDGYTSEKVADVEYVVDGKFMTVKIAKSDLGLTGDDYTINFTWTDNVHDKDDLGAISKDGWVYSEFSGDIMDFYLTGDVAPGARFKFSYISNEENANKVEDETTDTTEDTTDVVTEDTTEVTDVTTEATTDGTVEDTTVAADGGCKSSVALSAIAVLTALGAAVVLKKRD